MKVKISFSLKSGVQGEVPVIANISYGYKVYDELLKKDIYHPLKYYPNIKVHRLEWDDELKRPKNKAKYAELIKVEETIKEVYNYLKMQGEVDPITLKNELDIKIKGKKVAKTNNRVRLVDFINEELSRTSKTNFFGLSDKTKEHYEDLAKKLIAFEDTIGKKVYSNNIDAEMYLSFIEGIKKQMNKNNSVWSIQKIFKSTLKKIKKKYKITVFDMDEEIDAKQKVKLVSTDELYFTFEHIQTIINYKPTTERLQNTKLILLTLIFTGCRDSDVSKIEPKYTYNEKGVKFKYAQFFSQKGDVDVIVPILKPLEQALKENGNKPPYQLTNSAFNTNVKDLIEECGLIENNVFTFVDSYGKKQLATKEFFNRVSSHIGRRSFITHLIDFIPQSILSKITGHSTDKSKTTIEKYNKKSLLDNAVIFRRLLEQMQTFNPEFFPIKLV